jgi:UDP-2,3-diacylglucosamine pyrophosphatase LpxH
MKYRTIVLSDIHLGSEYSKSEEVVEFLKASECDKLILNGDIIDGWSLKRGNVWSDSHMRCVRKILKMTKRCDVYWIRGNHDDFLFDFLPFKIGKLSIVDNHVHMGLDGIRYLILHGDIFDIFITDMKWLAKLGSLGYDLCLWLNKWYNKYREFRGLEYFSLSKVIKDSFKKAASFINDFENHMVNHARDLDYGGVICGHIHKAEIKDIAGIRYMNSGDWQETCSALVEHLDGRWEILYYTDFKKNY